MKKILLGTLLIVIAFSLASASAQGLGGKHLAVSYEFMAAIQADGTVKAVGDNEYGHAIPEHGGMLLPFQLVFATPWG